jgi:ABC-type nitrate/sulfonate/bicarbonate transport system substrate-binding protein
MTRTAPTTGTSGILQASTSRRGLLRAVGAGALGLAGTGALAACGSSASGSSAAGGGSTSSAKVQLAYLTNVQFAGSYFAAEKGYYKAGGLDVQLLSGGPNLAPEPIVAGGKAILGITHTAELASAVTNGAKLKVIGAGYQKNPYCILSLADKPVTTPEELIGKKVGISASNNPVWQAFLKANSIDVSKINVVTMQFDPTPLASGEIDAMVAFYTNEPGILKTQGIDTHSLLMQDFGYPLMEDLYIARESDLADAGKRQQIVALMTAEAKGWQDVVADPQAATDLTVSKYGKALKLDPAQQLLEAKAQNDLVVNDDTKAHGLFWMTDASIASTITSLGLGDVKATPDLFTLDVLKDVYKNGPTA